MELVHGPDFPTGGVIVDSAEAIAAAYETGRGSFRVRARLGRSRTGPQGIVDRGDHRDPVPGAQGQADRADRPADRRPQAADPRGRARRSDEQIRIVLEPRSRTVDPELLMDSLFRLTDLEVRISLNLNVLDADRTPRVMGLKEVLSAGSRFQIDVLVSRSQPPAGEDRRPARAARRLYHRLPQPRPGDRDHPHRGRAQAGDDRRVRADRPPGRGDPQHAPAQLAQARGNGAPQGARRAAAGARGAARSCSNRPARQRTRLKNDLAALRKHYGPETALGRRRTLIEEAGPAREIPLDAMIEREPITVILSQRGWIRAMKGHVELANAEALKFKEGDGPAFAFHAQTTDKLLLAADDGRFYTLGADKLPGGRGFGEPVQADARHRRRGQDRRLLSRRRGREAAARLVGRTRLRHRGRRRDRRDAQGQADRQPASPARSWRSCGRSSRATIMSRWSATTASWWSSARRAARNGARPGRPAAALSRRRPVRRDHLPVRRGPELGDGRRKRPHPHRNRPQCRGARRAAPPAGCRRWAFPRDNRSE